MVATTSLLIAITLLHQSLTYYKISHSHRKEFFKSFIGLCYFYHRHCPLFETNIKPLRKLQRLYYRNDIHIIGWTLSTVQLFHDCKSNLINSPILIRYDSSKPTFFKIYWFTSSMGYILIQSDNSSVSLVAINYLTTIGEFVFDLFLSRWTLFTTCFI